MSSPAGPVVVGLDGSPESDLALDWAYAEAARFERPVHLVLAVEPHPLEAAPEVQRELADRGDELLQTAAQRSPSGSDGVTTAKVHERAAHALITASDGAFLVVVGSRGHGGFSEMLLGSVSQHVARHAKCPVAVIRAPAVSGSSHIVVGVDAHGVADPAVRFAFELASRHGEPLTAVYAVMDGPMAVSNADRFGHERGGDVLRQVLAGWREKYPSVEVTETATMGHPARVLTAASESASTVVVGTRGRGAFSGMLLGSTSQELLHRAHCPVVVVR